MRIAMMLTGGALALAAPALAQTAAPQTTAPQATPTPAADPSAAATTSTTTSATTTTTAAAPQVVNPAVGVKVFDPAGTEVGTIKAMDAQFVTLTTAKGEVKLPAAGVGPGANGAAVGLTAAQLDAAVAQAAPAQPAATETKTTTTTKTTRKTR